MEVQIIVVVLLMVLGFVVLTAWRWIFFPNRRPWYQYRVNLRWYRSSEKHLLYVIGGRLPAPAVVIDGFNYWTGKIRMRKLRAIPGAEIVEEYHANQISQVVFSNSEAAESTIVQ